MSGLFDKQIPQEIDPETNLPIGTLVESTEPAQLPEKTTLDGQYCRLEPLSLAEHGEDLYRASTPDDAAGRFRYLFESAPRSKQEFIEWANTAESSDDPLFFAVIDKSTGRAEGRQALMRIDPTHQSIEIGSIYWGPAITRSRITTEANFLFASLVFDQLGYRRYEWKCNALNAPSRRAAARFGFRYEGHFRRAVIVRGRTRDTTWFSIIKEDWPDLKAAYEKWLSLDNFDADGQQKLRLSDLTAALAGED